MMLLLLNRVSTVCTVARLMGCTLQAYVDKKKKKRKTRT